MAKTKKEAAKKDAPKKSETEKVETEAVQTEEQDAPMLSVLAQYIKDSSFENPSAPESLRSDLSPPEISINIEIGRQMLEGGVAEVVLMFSAKAERDNKPVFLCELEYAGLFTFGNVPEEHLLPMIMIECPRLLFPFARQIMADMTQSGGYPPILLDPPDFAGMFRAEMMRRAAEQGEGAALN
ncbi:MAG: protein-export chaperone SecB [Robiginitomaculum sp.]|nr:MAG: protein-export chaperone SecB [Robiginitomaculum sp.]